MSIRFILNVKTLIIWITDIIKIVINPGTAYSVVERLCSKIIAVLYSGKD